MKQRPILIACHFANINKEISANYKYNIYSTTFISIFTLYVRCVIYREVESCIGFFAEFLLRNGLCTRINRVVIIMKF